MWIHVETEAHYADAMIFKNYLHEFTVDALGLLASAFKSN